MIRTLSLVTLADLAGTALFAAEGGLRAVAAHLDVLGVGVIAFLAALGGGLLRDVLLGAYPVAALSDRRYPLAVLCGAVFAVAAGGWLAHWQRPILILDAGGLALFAASGTIKALMRGARGFAAVVMGMLSATGGGVLRDLMLGTVPEILRTGFYASAAILEAVAIVLLHRLGVAMPVAACVGAVGGMGLRCAAIVWGWTLPRF